MKLIRYALAAAVAALSLAVVAPLAAAHPAKAKTQTVKVTLKEFKFIFSTKKVHAGTVVFDLVNKGKVAHDMRIAGKTSAHIKPGKTGKLVVKLKKGKYVYECTLPGHAALGMKGVLTVS